ncbi:DUF2922 family protein [Clostridium sp.]|uniref:DUF2922 family protein n=1 Tax=Clostridium sp. TaxID=1506 RepID=UPI003F7DBE93
MVTYTLYIDFKSNNDNLIRFRIPNVPIDIDKNLIKELMECFIENQEIFELNGEILVEKLGANIEGRTNNHISY